ncbi:MAG TPA: hypothetical protein VGH84_02695 [Steroidobacteraceae bacterium]
MASYQQLIDDTLGWLNRQDAAPFIPGWVLLVETQLAQTLRARCMVKFATQAIDAPYITMPPDFATMESIRDNATGELLELKDAWSGHWTAPSSDAWVAGATVGTQPVATAYRLTGDCLEFLPHPMVPDPPDPAWQPQQVRMGWYAKPKPLVLPDDTNPILEQLYGVYLFGVLSKGAIWALDDARAQQADTQWQTVITQANLSKQQSDYSGAPYRSELATVF